MATFFYFTAIFLLFFLCLLLCSAILLQESKSSGLGSSLGGDGGDSLFGTSTADILKKFTAYLSAAFLITCILLSFWTASLARNKASSPTPPAVIESEQ